MVSSLGYAILALLATKPQSGYDLARQMKPPLGFLWQAKHGQIYPELARLAKSGLVDFEREDKGSGPPRRIHAITPKGRTTLASWVLQPPQAKATNDELVVKAYALRGASRAKAGSLVTQELHAHEQRLAALEQMANALRTRAANSIGIESARFGEYAALRRVVGSEREYIAWCHWLLRELDGDRGRLTGRTDARGRTAARPGGRRR